MFTSSIFTSKRKGPRHTPERRPEIPPKVQISKEEEHLQAAVNAAERLGRLNHRRLEALEALANHYTRQGRLREAEPLWVKSLSLQEKIYGPEHQRLAQPLVDLSHHYERMGRYAESEAVLCLALKIHERDAVENSSLVANDLVALARATARQERWPEADNHLTRARNIVRIVHGEKSLALARLNLAQADLMRKRQHFDTARAWILKATALLQQLSGDRNPDTAEAWTLLGHVEKEEKNYGKALALYRRAQHVHLRTAEDGAPSVGTDLLHQGLLHVQEGKPRRAIRVLHQALTLKEKSLGLHHPDVAEIAVPLAEAHAALRNSESAELNYLRAWGVFERTLGPDAPGLLQAQYGLAALYFDRSCYDEADRLLAQLVRSTERIYGPHHSTVQAAITNARISLEAQDRWDEAKALPSSLPIGGHLP
jgi:tetratricopeptide (TPR) repeat protein